MSQIFGRRQRGRPPFDLASRGQLKESAKIPGRFNVHDEALQLLANLKLAIRLAFSECPASTITRVFFTVLPWITLVFVDGVAAAELPEYTAAESKKHIGETARVTGKMDCVDAHRRSHILTLGGCEPKMDFYVRVAYGVPGPDLNVTELKGVVITASGKIEKSEVDDRPFIDVTSTSQIASHKLKRAQAEAATVQQSGEDSSEPNGSVLRPTSAEVVDIPAAQAQFGIKAETSKSATRTVTQK